MCSPPGQYGSGGVQQSTMPNMSDMGEQGVGPQHGYPYNYGVGGSFPGYGSQSQGGGSGPPPAAFYFPQQPGQYPQYPQQAMFGQSGYPQPMPGQPGMPGPQTNESYQNQAGTMLKQGGYPSQGGGQGNYPGNMPAATQALPGGVHPQQQGHAPIQQGAAGDNAQVPGGAPAMAAAPRQPGVWQELFDTENRPYYYNTFTGITQWDKPPDFQPQGMF
eukprot:TRINITY_DN3088_c0_g1_i1.p3 TRINITY_DN3088_c0_g1~~TRINITY_DN3088_c0_g1_i1.p3  ORF type:complete len:217 (-),score=31.22 TRINITY_DN3088_c0_g1_i1:1169-1819(-)